MHTCSVADRVSCFWKQKLYLLWRWKHFFLRVASWVDGLLSSVVVLTLEERIMLERKACFSVFIHFLLSSIHKEKDRSLCSWVYSLHYFIQLQCFCIGHFVCFEKCFKIYIHIMYIKRQYDSILFFFHKMNWLWDLASFLDILIKFISSCQHPQTIGALRLHTWRLNCILYSPPR